MKTYNLFNNFTIENTNPSINSRIWIFNKLYHFTLKPAIKTILLSPNSTPRPFGIIRFYLTQHSYEITSSLVFQGLELQPSHLTPVILMSALPRSDGASILGGVRLPPDTEIIKYTSSIVGPKVRKVRYHISLLLPASLHYHYH